MGTTMVVNHWHKFPEIEDLFNVHIVEYANCEGDEYVGDDNELVVYKDRNKDEKVIWRDWGLSWKQEEVILKLIELGIPTRTLPESLFLNCKNLFGENITTFDWRDLANKFRDLGVIINIKRDRNVFTNAYTGRWVWSIEYKKEHCFCKGDFMNEVYAIMNMLYYVFPFYKNHVDKDFNIHYFNENWDLSI